MRFVLACLVCHAAAFIGYDGQSYEPAQQHRPHHIHKHNVFRMLNSKAQSTLALRHEAHRNLVHSFVAGSRGEQEGPMRALHKMCMEKGWANRSEFHACRKEVETVRCAVQNTTAAVPNITTKVGEAKARVAAMLQRGPVAGNSSAGFSKEWCNQWWANSTAVFTANARNIHLHSEPKEGKKDETKDEKKKAEKKENEKEDEKKDAKEDSAAALPGPAPAPVASPMSSPAAAPGPAPGPGSISNLPLIVEAEAFELGGEFDSSQCATSDDDGNHVCVSPDPKRNPPACFHPFRVVPLGGGRYTCWTHKDPALVLPEQGFTGPDAEHVDGDTWTEDFGVEYGPRSQLPGHSKSYDEVVAEACRHHRTKWCINNGYDDEDKVEELPLQQQQPKKAKRSGSQGLRTGVLQLALTVTVSVATLLS